MLGIGTVYICSGSSLIQPSYSEHDKSFSNIALNSLLLYSQHVESDSLGNWSTLSDSDDITHSSSCETWGHVCWEIVMSLLESIVLLDEMKVISSQDNSVLHLS